MYSKILDNYRQVLEHINTAAKLTGRDPDDIRLVVVTKTQPIEAIQEVVDAGAANLGENYVEEAIQKINYFKNKKGLSWHMIGHVQSRKALPVCENFQFLHSLDSVKLAERLSRSSIDKDRILPVMLEINVGGEESKSGWNLSQDGSWESFFVDIEKIRLLPGLKLTGVMTIPPFSNNPEDSRNYYQRLYMIKEMIANKFNLPDFSELSMGMSNDYEVAIQEGSTWVRIGQAIFGPRVK
jgi:pyridoxal phosphate enzyme (YggS family)